MSTRATIAIAAIATGVAIAWCRGDGSTGDHTSRWVTESAGKLTAGSNRRRRWPGSAEVIARNPMATARTVVIALTEGCSSEHISMQLWDQDGTPIPHERPLCEPVRITVRGNGYVRVELWGYDVNYRVVVTGE